VFIRIDAQHAGPNALGILVPPGARTLVIVRPRALEWDLLPARWDGDHGHAPTFCTFTRDDAASVARQLIQELDAAIRDGVDPLETFGNPDGTRVQIWLRTKEHVWIVCRRQLGQHYEPMIFTSRDAANAAAASLAAIVSPSAGVEQPYYFNTQGFH
jgi:hypothetical protein